MKKQIRGLFYVSIILLIILTMQVFVYSISSLCTSVSRNLMLQTELSTIHNNLLDESPTKPLMLKNDNKQVYINDEGQTNTIYWARGVQAPLMDNKDGNLNKEGYFERYYDKKISANGYVTETLYYESQLTPNKGYYDLNKNFYRMNAEQSYCYLCSASNLLYWWLEQNSSFIEQYLQQISLGNFVASEGLVDIENMTMWSDILTPPQLVLTDGLLTQEMTKCGLATAFKETFIKRNQGYWMDRVIDHFINGYIAISDDSQNDESLYRKQQYGGYFYPIFNKTRLSHRYTRVDYDFYNENLVKFIQDNKGLSLSYFNKKNGSHAITVWGVEYDQNNNLKRVYVTDSDDYNQTTTRNTDKIRSLYSLDVKMDESNGQIYLTTNIDKNAHIGSRLQSFVTLDLAQDVWQEKLNDLTPPVDPQIVEQPKDNIYSKNEIHFNTLNVKIKEEKGGYLEYQWYKSDSDGGVGVKIDGAIKSYIHPDKPLTVPKYYYCEIINNKNGKRSNVVKTRYAKIALDDDVVNAEAPIVNYVLNNGSTSFEYNQFDQPKPLKINASSPDGGTLSYQWYLKIGSMDYSPSGGTLIPGETSNVFYPLTNKYEDGTQYVYYCIVTNKKEDVNGRQETPNAPKNSLKVVILDKRELQNALQPGVSTKLKGGTYNSVNEIEPLSVRAKSLDGGVLSYKWFVNDNLIENEMLSNFKPTNLKNGINYIYCEVTNTNVSAKQTTTNSIKTNVVEIFIDANIPKPSDNNNLISLDIGYELNPVFNPSKTEYSLSVPYSVSSVSIVAQKADEKAKVTGDGEKILQVGKNVVSVNVEAENGDIKTYTITITRKTASVENSLLSITLNGDSILIDFDKDVLEYNITVPNSCVSIDVNAVPVDSNGATVKVSGNNNLKVGNDNVISIQVTAENGDSKIYTIKVNRQAPEKEDIDLTNIFIYVGCVGGLFLVVCIILIILKFKKKNYEK